MAGREIGAQLTKVQKMEVVSAYLEGEPTGVIAKRYRIHPTYPGILAKRFLGHQSLVRTRTAMRRRFLLQVSQ